LQKSLNQNKLQNKRSELIKKVETLMKENKERNKGEIEKLKEEAKKIHILLEKKPKP